MIKRFTVLGVGFTLLVLVALAGMAIVASANHGGYPSTVDPHDRSTGADEVTVESRSVSLAPHGGLVETHVFPGTSPAECSSTDVRAFGIDRGNNNSGTETDESMVPYVWNATYTEDGIYVAYNDDSPAMNTGDALVSVQDGCYKNPSEPGWYQASGDTWVAEMSQDTNSPRGWEPDGDPFVVKSHYYWICDCEDEEEAYEVLGPPPSQQHANVEFNGTVTEGGTAIIESAELEGGGYVTVYSDPPENREEVRGGQLGFPAPMGSFLGASTYLEPGSHDGIEISLGSTPDDGDQLYVVPHRETFNEGEFQYIELWEDDRGLHDLPYMEERIGEPGQTRYWEATVDIEDDAGPTSTPATADTSTPATADTSTPATADTPTPMTADTPTADEDDDPGEQTPATPGDGAGPGPLVTMTALLAGLALLYRRREQ